MDEIKQNLDFLNNRSDMEERSSDLEYKNIEILQMEEETKIFKNERILQEIADRPN